MHISEVQIRHFRNLAPVRWKPAPGLNLIYGRNGQGKTNLLEGIHVALTGRSFRTRRDEELIPWPESAASAGGDAELADPTLCQTTLDRQGRERRLRVILLGRGRKRAFADSNLLPRLGALLEEAAVVVFTPDDAALFKGPPAARRRFLDMALAQTSRDYLAQLQQFSQAQRQLTAAYRMRGSDAAARDAARAFTPLAARAGAELMAARAARLAEARDRLAERHRALGGTEELDLVYDPDLRKLPAAVLRDAALRPRDADVLGPLVEHYRRILDDGFDEARRLGGSPTGAQRDDFAACLAGQDLRRFGSQGQHRLAALALKLESAAWIEASLGETPVLLLDDFGSELDRERREATLASLRRSMQVIVTATEREDLAPAPFDRAARMEGGKLHPDGPRA